MGVGYYNPAEILSAVELECKISFMNQTLAELN